MPQRVLVVEDEPENRLLLGVVLTSEGYEVVEAEDGRAALAAVRDRPPDLILLDGMMPEVDGLDALRQLKSSVETAAIPVIMLTALDGLADVALATMGGAESYVTKPFEPADLASLVRRFIEAPAA